MRGRDTGGQIGSRGKDTGSAEEEIQEAASDPKAETREVPLDPEEETQEVPPNPEEEAREAPSDPEEEIIDEVRLATESTDLERPVVPAPRKLTISGNLPPSNVTAHAESTGARRREKNSAVTFSADGRGRRREDCEDVRWRGRDNFAEEGGDTGADSEGHVTGAVDR